MVLGAVTRVRLSYKWVNQPRNPYVRGRPARALGRQVQGLGSAGATRELTHNLSVTLLGGEPADAQSLRYAQTPQQ